MLPLKIIFLPKNNGAWKRIGIVKGKAEGRTKEKREEKMEEKGKEE